MIVTVTLNPALDKFLKTRGFRLNRLNRVSEAFVEPGGKGINIGYVLNVLGQEVVAMGFVGGRVGHYLEERLRNFGLTTNFVHVDGDTRTNYIIVDEKRKSQTQVNEPGPLVHPEEMEQLKERFARILSYTKMVVIAGSLPPGVDPYYCGELVKMAQSQGVKVALNLYEEPLNITIKSRPYLAKPDIRVSPRFMGMPMKYKKKRIEALKKLREETDIAIISLGFDALIASEEGIFEFEAPVCEVASTVKIDDAFLAGVIDVLVKDGDIVEAGRKGMAAALTIASSLGGEIESKEEIEAHLDRVEVRKIES
jgi:1-phosphofructokinase